MEDLTSKKRCWVFRFVEKYGITSFYVGRHRRFNKHEVDQAWTTESIYFKEWITIEEISTASIFFKIYNLITVCLLLLAFLKMFNLKNKDTIITMSILFIFMFIIRFASHHSGILFLLIMFGIISYYDEIIEKNKKFDKLLIVVLILYTVLSIQSGINDYRYEYSGAKEMASYIEKMKYDEKKIVGFGFKDISLQPYFEKKLYTNWDETIYRWSYKNKDFYSRNASAAYSAY